MNAPAFIDGLQARGATLQLEGATLRVTPANALTSADRAAWQHHKREIIAYLETAITRSEPQTVTPPLPPSLVGIPGIEFCQERGEWIRRIGDGVWRVPLAKSPPAPVDDDFAEESHRLEKACDYSM